MRRCGSWQAGAALLLAALLALGGCGKTAPETPPAPVVPKASVAASASAIPAGWLGRWQGPEGTFLEISGGPGAYRVTVQNLDGPRSFDATAGAAGNLGFVRDGVNETLSAGDGAKTGMKWLADKRDCIIVKPGEGYCRD
jgi:hypothetical protein